MNGLLRATSLRAGSYDKLRSERDLRFYRIRDEALCLNALHDFAGAPKLSCAIKDYTRSNGDFRDAVLAFDVFKRKSPKLREAAAFFSPHFWRDEAGQV